MISGPLLRMKAAILRWPRHVLGGVSRLVRSKRDGEGALELLVELNIKYVADFRLKHVLVKLDLVLNPLSILLDIMTPYTRYEFLVRI